MLLYLLLASLLTIALVKLRLLFGPFALYGFALSALGAWLLLLVPFLAGVPFAHATWNSASAQSGLFHGAAGLFTIDLVALTSVVSALLNQSYRRLEQE